MVEPPRKGNLQLVQTQSERLARDSQLGRSRPRCTRSVHTKTFTSPWANLASLKDHPNLSTGSPVIHSSDSFRFRLPGFVGNQKVSHPFKTKRTIAGHLWLFPAAGHGFCEKNWAISMSLLALYLKMMAVLIQFGVATEDCRPSGVAANHTIEHCNHTNGVALS